MNATDVALSIIIVNWNTRQLLARCLESLEDHFGASARLNVETFVVDNGSTDGSAEIVEQRFPWVRLIANSENAGFARANNQGIARSRGRYVVLLNSDTDVHPGALDVMVAFMEEHAGAAGCGPRLVHGDGSLQPSCHPMLTPGREFWRLMFLDRVWHRATYDQERWNPGEARRVEVIKGACLMLRRKALDQVGLLDERYFVYTEEMDLCYRLLQAGWELYWVPWAEVTHYGEASSKQIAEEMYVQLYRSKVQFHGKFGGEGEARRFRQLLGIAYGPRWAVASMGSFVLPSLGQRARVYGRVLREVVVG